MAWVTTLLAILQMIPQIFSSIRAFAGWVHQEVDLISKSQKAKALASAITQAIKTKDTSALDQLFNGGANGANTSSPSKPAS